MSRVLATSSIIMAPPGERPHIVLGPDDWFSDMREILYPYHSCGDPMKVNDIRVAFIDGMDKIPVV